MNIRHPLLALILASLALFSEAKSQQVGTSPVKIFVMIGQSNMLGKGTIAPVTTPGTLEYVVANDPGNHYQFLKSAGNWVVRDDVWIRDQDPVAGGLTVGFGGEAAGLIGPELGFGHHVGDLYEQQVLIIKCAWGGKSLGNDFLPPSSGPYPDPQQAGNPGFYYKEVLRLVNEATTNLGTYFPDYNAAGGYEIVGICWHQGWNDRVSGAFADAYETNMANFINDIRSSENGLGVPGLPFVIATTGMDGSPNVYSKVETAQKKMDNSTGDYPDFAGNVAVVDTRASYEYDNGLVLDFWQPVTQSPANEGYHWNRNAKSYLHIGLAMGDAMSTLSPSRCPSRLRASPASPGGITLTWQNGTETPTSVRVLRDGNELAATAPVSPATFTDSSALPGIHNYELIFTMPGDACDPLTVTFDGSIANLLAFRSPSGVGLTWESAMSYTGIELKRDGVVLQANLPGDATSYTDTSAPSTGLVTYTLTPTTGTSTPASTQINLNGLPSGNALIYEPFDYAVGGLNVKSGNSEVGLAGTWNANGTTLVTAGTLSYGNLPVGGGKLSDFTGSQNRFGGARGINTSALADEGMLADGATLWFSAIVGYDTGGNVTNSRLAIALANSGFSPGNYDYWINDEGEQVGSGIGITLGNEGGNGSVVATRFRNLAAGDGLNGNSHGTFTGSVYAAGTYGLIVGKMTWASDPANPDIIEIFQPGTDLALPASPISVLNTQILAQSEFDTITFARGDKVMLDEIRFGKSYDSVIGKVSYADWIAEYPALAGQAGFGDDPDGDDVDNGLENYLGTDPGTPSQGIISGLVTDGSFTFSHPLSNKPADDIVAKYKWSTDLVSFHEDGETANGTLVNFTKGTPSGGVIGVSANITGNVPERIFVVLDVVEQP